MSTWTALNDILLLLGIGGVGYGTYRGGKYVANKKAASKVEA